MRCLLSLLALLLLCGCRSQTTAMTNPFIAPNRVPPPATRTLLPGTAQPYYPGDPLPNSPAIGAPPVGYAPGVPVLPATPTYSPQPAGVVPPGGWGTAPQSSYNVVPSNVAPSGVNPIVVQPDQQNLRFAQPAPMLQPAVPMVQPPVQIVQPPIPRPAVSPYPNQLATYQAPFAQQSFVQPFVQQSVPIASPRQVRIRAISSDNLPTSSNLANVGQSVSRDGFRPQGSRRVQ